jgi:uncharacterized protein YkwD
MRPDGTMGGRRLRAALCGTAMALGSVGAAADEGDEQGLRARAEQVLNQVRQQVARCDAGHPATSVAVAQDATAGGDPGSDRPPLRWNPQLAEAAARHTGAMARTRVFAHVGSDGTTVRERVAATGYRWQAVAETLAAGQPDLIQAVRDWLASASHCAALVDARYTEFGIARSSAVHPSDAYRTYWTLVLGRPR